MFLYDLCCFSSEKSVLYESDYTLTIGNDDAYEMKVFENP